MNFRKWEIMQMEEEQEEVEEQSLSIDYSVPFFPIYKRVLKYYLPPRVTVWVKYDYDM